MVARDVKMKGYRADDFYAAMPPLEAKEVLFAKVAERCDE